MYRILSLLVALALTAISWSSCEAAGSFQTKPAFANALSASYEAAPALVPMAHATVAPDMACGKGRVRDPATHGCRGPADIR
jgi:hypothetical protein